MTYANAADPILFNNKIFISMDWKVGGTLLEITENGFKVLWENKNMQNDFSTCVLVDGYLYGSSGSADLPTMPFCCIDFETGAVMWEKKMSMASLIA
jgi:hypothetical protein